MQRTEQCSWKKMNDKYILTSKRCFVPLDFARNQIVKNLSWRRYVALKFIKIPSSIAGVRENEDLPHLQQLHKDACFEKLRILLKRPPETAAAKYNY